MKQSTNHEVKKALFDIVSCDGQEKADAHLGAIEEMKAALAKKVAEDPLSFGLNDEDGQRNFVDSSVQGFSAQFLSKCARESRLKAGYVNMFGKWIHRSMFTFAGFGLLAAIFIPVSVVQLLSPSKWGFHIGLTGLFASLVIGGLIVWRVKN